MDELFLGLSLRLWLILIAALVAVSAGSYSLGSIRARHTIAPFFGAITFIPASKGDIFLRFEERPLLLKKDKPIHNSNEILNFVREKARQTQPRH